MSGLIDYAINHARLTVAMLIFLLCAGLVSYVTIAKEAEPDVKIPIIYVHLSQRGISPEDAERLLLRPVETQLKSVGNVKEMRSQAFEGGGYVSLEFEAGFDSKAALADVRAKVDQAKHDLPRDVDEPQVTEVNLSLYPVLVVGLSGEVPERTLLRIARATKNAIEQAPGVLSAELRGARDEAVEIILDPALMNSYGLSIEQLGSITKSVNTLLAACVGFVMAMGITNSKYGKPDISMSCNGMLAGLVAITAPCAFVAPWASVVIGIIAGFLVCYSVEFFDRKAKVDDPCGAISVHGVCGLWGVLAVGLFADGTYGDAWNGIRNSARALLRRRRAASRAADQPRRGLHLGMGCHVRALPRGQAFREGSGGSRGGDRGARRGRVRPGLLPRVRHPRGDRQRHQLDRTAKKLMLDRSICIPMAARS
jgi:hypothetical protein